MSTTDVAKKVLTNESKRIKVRFGQNLISGTVASSTVNLWDRRSPNGDGINDLFVIENLEAYPGSTLEIFNRWGTKVYESDNYINDWEGISINSLNIGGGDLPEGTYFYHLKLGGDPSLESHGEILQGYVYIKR